MRKDYNLEKRKYVIGGFICVIVFIYLIRLFSLQVGDDKYKESAESNAFFKRVIYPARGLVYDRNGKLVVFNKPAYDVMIIPKDVKDFDTLAFCQALEITKEDLALKWEEMKNRGKSRILGIYTSETHLTSLSGRLWSSPGKTIPLSRLLHPEKNGARICFSVSRKHSGKYP